MASPHRQPAVSITPIEQQDELAQSYNAALQAFESARRVVADLSSGLHDPHAAQMDVSARISSRQGRCTLTGRKRKMSPCLYDFGDHAPSSCPGAGAKADTPTQVWTVPAVLYPPPHPAYQRRAQPVIRRTNA